MSAEGSSSSSAQVDPSEKAEVMKKADGLLAQGKRNMVCGEVMKAVSFFEEAVKILVSECGEMSRDCADAYYNYGGALLELGRIETNVLGTALDGVDIEEENDEGESESDQFEKPPADDAEADNQDDDGENEGEEEENEEDGEKENEEDAADKENPEAEGTEEKDGDDLGHFQLAWEHLDIAKVLYSKKEEKGDQLKAAECLIKLGELGMEIEQHETAATDLEAALVIQKKYLAEDNRSLAETHYQLGLAYSLTKEFEKAIQAYQSAISVIEAKIVSLNKLIEEKEEGADNKENCETDALMKYKEEIKELQEIIPEMRNKIEDTKVEERDLQKMREMACEMLGLSSASKGFGSPSKRVNLNGAGSSESADVDENGEKKPKDIAHLVRRKRKPEDDEPISSALELKKIRQEETASSNVKPVTENGAASTEEINTHTPSEEKKKTEEPMTS